MIRNRLPEIMRREGLTAYRLAKTIAHRAARNTVFRWARGEVPACLDVRALEAILFGLRTLTGKNYGVGDLFTYEEVADGGEEE